MNEKDFSSIFQSAVVISPRTLCKKLFYRAPAAQKWNKRQYKTRKRKKKKELQVLFSSSLYRSDLTGVCRSITNRFWPPTLSLLPPDVAMTCLVQVLWHDTLAKNHSFLIWIVTCGMLDQVRMLSFPFWSWAAHDVAHVHMFIGVRLVYFLITRWRDFFRYAKCNMNWPRKKRAPV